MRPIATGSLIFATMVLSLFSADTACAASDDDAPRPWMSRTLEAAARRMLQHAFPVAIKKIETRSSCSGLFEELGADPVEALTTTKYFPPQAGEAKAICLRRGAAGFTAVGSTVTRLCPRFGSLRVHEAARLILHEGLHRAGMPEKPHAADAMTSRQIDLLVSRRCGL